MERHRAGSQSRCSLSSSARAVLGGEAPNTSTAEPNLQALARDAAAIVRELVASLEAESMGRSLLDAAAARGVVG